MALPFFHCWLAVNLGFFWWCCYKWFSHLCVSLLLCLPNLHECFSTSLLSRSFAHHRVSILLSFSWPFLRTYLVFDLRLSFSLFFLDKESLPFFGFYCLEGRKKIKSNVNILLNFTQHGINFLTIVILDAIITFRSSFTGMVRLYIPL